MVLLGKVPTEPNSSTSTRSSSADQYPVGMRVLVVDDDTISLNVLKMCLLICGYHVTTCTGGVQALSLLRENRRAYDLVMLDVHMPGMNGLQLLQVIGREMDIPVVMVSGDSSQEMVMEGLNHGACDYLVKPFTVNQVRNVWQHVVRYCQNAAKNNNTRKRDGGGGDDSDNSDHNPKKKRRVKWSSELHHKFLEAVNKLGIDKAVPKKILELMDVPGLSKEQVASHLQKFRECLKKAAGVTRPNPVRGGVPTKLTAHALGSAAASGRAGAETTAVPGEGSGPPGTLRNSPQTRTQRSASRPGPPANAPPADQNQLVQREQSTTQVPLEAYGCGEEDGMLQEDFLVRYFRGSNEDAFLYTF